LAGDELPRKKKRKEKKSGIYIQWNIIQPLKRKKFWLVMTQVVERLPSKHEALNSEILAFITNDICNKCFLEGSKEWNGGCRGWGLGEMEKF
jgi:hypothetical protein